MVRYYFESYRDYDINSWQWNLENSEENNKMFLRFRARRSPDKDILPDFSFIEKEATEFKMNTATFTDIFGIKWVGKRGVFKVIGAPDYEQHLYFYGKVEDEDEEVDDSPIVSDLYTRLNPPKHYIELNENASLDDGKRKYYLYINDILDVTYDSVVTNHALRDSAIVLNFKNGDEFQIASDLDNYKILVKHLSEKLKRPDLVAKIVEGMNCHLKLIKNSKDSDISKRFPNKTAEELLEIKPAQAKNKIKNTKKVLTNP